MYETDTTAFFRRLAAPEMQEIFSADMRVRTWRRLWLGLAEAQADSGVDISEAQLEEIRLNANDINHGFAALKERECRDPAAAHLQAFAAQCPQARSILSLGAGADFAYDNSRPVLLRTALLRIKRLLINALAALADLAEDTRTTPCRSFAGRNGFPTTLGCRMALVCELLMNDLATIDQVLDHLFLPGCRGDGVTSIGTSLLMNGEQERVGLLEKKLAEQLGFSRCATVSGALCGRKNELNSLNALSSLAMSINVFANDLLYLGEQNQLREEELLPSVERLSALARFVAGAAAAAVSNMVMPSRELNESGDPFDAVMLPQSFLASDAMLTLLIFLCENSKFDQQSMRDSLAATLADDADLSSLTATAAAQTAELLEKTIDPILLKNQKLLGMELNIKE